MAVNPLVSFSAVAGSLDLTTAAIVVDSDDYEGIRIAADFLSKDLAQVTQRPPRPIQHCSAPTKGSKIDDEVVILVGSIELSRPLELLEEAGKVDFNGIRGGWECFSTCVVDEPLPGATRGLIIAGSDKRGGIYGIYTLSEQIGISP